MKPATLAAALCLFVTMGPPLCRAELLPGDIALTRIQDNVVSLMALRPIAAGEEIRITNSNWVNGSFDGSGGGGAVNVPASGLQPGDQWLINLSGLGITVDWGTTLHFFQRFIPPFSSESRTRHLLVVELNKDGLRWQTNIPDGLIRDVTHITIREQFEGQGMDHLIKEGLLTVGLTPYQWMRALGSFRAWTHGADYASPISLSAWAELKLSVNPSPGIISLPLQAQNYSSAEGQIYVPVRRSFGSSGNCAVTLRALDKVGPFRRWQNETISGVNMDFTDVAFGPGVGFVAVSPNSGLILLNNGGGWNPKETNDTPGDNLQLSGIMHDGSNFWACSIKGGIYRSGDGINWIEVRAGKTGEQLLRIHHLKEAEFPFVAVGGNGLALFSTDGSNWSAAEIPGTPELFGAAFFGGHYVLCGQGGLIIHSNSPSKTWTSSSTPNTNDLFSIATIDVGGTPTLLAVGQYGSMITTANLENAFIARQSNTRQSLFDILEATRNEGADKYVFAVGANGATVISVNGSGFKTPRFDPRAPSLYALAQDSSGKDPVVYGVGEYGSLTLFDSVGLGLSGSIAGIDLDGQGNSVDLNWESGSSGEKYVKLTKGVALTQFRERIDLELERPTNSGSPYRLGNDGCQINFFRSLNGNPPTVADNYGPTLNLTGAGLVVLTDEDWRLGFRIINTSRRTSQRLFIRFEGTNLPDFTIPDPATASPGSTIGPLEQTGLITTILRQPVESIALYEEFRSGEEVLKARTAINNLSANPEWVPNGIFDRSLGAYLLDSGGLGDPGIPGLGILGGGSQGGSPEPSAAPAAGQDPQLKTAPAPGTASGSGFVFSGTAPTPPGNNPESSELVLLSTSIGGPIGMDVRESYDFFLVGGFYNTGSGLLENYTMNTVDWAVTESSLPAVGLSIQDDTGAFVARAYPGVPYPRAVSIDSVTTEGAPLDGGGRPVEYSDSQGLSITEPASNRTYAEWVGTTTLAADEDDEGQDPDGDGIVNLLEYILGTDPDTANPMSRATSSFNAATGVLSFCFTIPNDLSAVTIKVETSTDLSTWTERTPTLDSSDSTTETWCVSVSLGGKGFARMKVETYTP